MTDVAYFAVSLAIDIVSDLIKIITFPFKLARKAYKK